MAARANPKLIGGFVVGGIALVVLMVVGFASTTFLATKIPFVMYFPGDVGGLDVGAAVTFKGVRIGTVTNVELHFDAAAKSFLIPVHAEIEPDRLTVKGTETITTPGENIPTLVKFGLRARLGSESLVTGKLLVDLDFHPDTEVKLVGGEPGMIEIPTIPTTLEELEASISGLLDSLGKANLPGLLVDVREMIDHLDKQVMAADPAGLLNRLEVLVQSVQQDVSEVSDSLTKTSDTLDQRISALAESLMDTSGEGERALQSANKMFEAIQGVVAAARPTLTSLEDTAERADALLAAANGIVQPGSPLQRELVAALKEIAGAARSLRALADNLERDPNSILFGKQPGGQ